MSSQDIIASRTLFVVKQIRRSRRRRWYKNHYIYLKRNMIVSGMYTILMEGMWHQSSSWILYFEKMQLNYFSILFFYKGVFLFLRPICVQIASLIIALSGTHHRNGSKQSSSIIHCSAIFDPIYISKIQSFSRKLICLGFVFFIIHILIRRKWWWSQWSFFSYEYV